MVGGEGGAEGDPTDWVEAVMLSWSSSAEVGGRLPQRMFAGGHQGDQGSCTRLLEGPGPALRRPDSRAGSCDCDSLEGSLEAGQGAGRVCWVGGEACWEAEEEEVSVGLRLEVLGLVRGLVEV